MGRPGEFFRLSNDPEAGIVLVEKGSAPGRSAYVCPNEKCIDAAMGKGRLSRAMKTTVPGERLEAIKKELICKLQSR